MIKGINERQLIENFFFIVDKESKKIPFKLNKAQSYVYENLGHRNLIPKDRQRGVTSFILALFLARCLLYQNRTCVVIAHEKAPAQKMLRQLKYYIRTAALPEIPIDVDNKNEISFPGTNSFFYIGSAENDDFGRGDRITDLHCSEVAFWSNPQEKTKGLFQAVPRTGTIVLESTGNGIEWFCNRVKRAAAKPGREKVLWFGGFVSSEEYRVNLTEEEKKDIIESLDPEIEEDVLYNDYGLTPGQIAWRREKLEELDYDLASFKQEYPLILEDCFQQKGFSFFHKVNYKPTKLWKVSTVDPDLKWIKKYADLAYKSDVNLTFVMGVDVGGGVGGDSSVIQIICLEENKQVATYKTNNVPPDIFAQRIAEVGRIYNFPIVVVESNNHGLTTLSYLKDLYPKDCIYKDKSSSNIVDLGMRTTKLTKPLMIGNLRRTLAEGMVIHSEETLSELNTFIEKGSGKLEAQDGYHDDEVMALAMAVAGAEKAHTLQEYRRSAINVTPVNNDPASLDFILNELYSRNNKFPVQRQLKVIN